MNAPSQDNVSEPVPVHLWRTPCQERLLFACPLAQSVLLVRLGSLAGFGSLLRTQERF